MISIVITDHSTQGERINYVSFSVYGEDPKYLVGALQNCKLIKEMMPGWVAVFFISKQAHALIGEKLRGDHVLVIVKDEISNNSSMTWRFEAIGLPDAAHVIFRDTDSRITPRETAAVAEWISSSRTLHIMRDHPLHGSKILGGMWGIYAPKAKHLPDLLRATEKIDAYGMDQSFLAANVYKQFKRSRLIHDSYFFREPGSKKFPLPRTGGQFIGEVIDQNEGYDPVLREMALKADRSILARMRIQVSDCRARAMRKVETLHFRLLKGRKSH